MPETPPAQGVSPLDRRHAQQVIIDYTNHRGVRAERLIEPRTMWFGTSEWHDGQQWFLNAEDVEKRGVRDFAMRDIHRWRNAR